MSQGSWAAIAIGDGISILPVRNELAIYHTYQGEYRMKNKHFLRGMSTVNYWADNVTAARDWYSKLFGIEAYFQQPSTEHPAYIEFRIGDDEDEFGIIDSKYAPKSMRPGPGGAILLWHVDDIEAVFE